MAKIKLIKVPPICSIQDKGRYGFRKWGIPQSGFIDSHMVNEANSLVKNAPDSALLDFAAGPLEVDAVDDHLLLGVTGVGFERSYLLGQGEKLKLPAPSKVYAYVALKGDLVARVDFGSKSTYALAGFGGLNGSSLQAGDILETTPKTDVVLKQTSEALTDEIRIIKGPEWHLLKETIANRSFTVATESNRMAIRLNERLQIDQVEMVSSAVIPGVIQLPAGGKPIILMNDCQTTGGYPRVAKVLDQDLGKLSQLKPASSLTFKLYRLDS
jgi:biotin-dependent carboxylase-like uncharacterized protein